MNDSAVTPQNALAILEKQDTPEAKAIIDYVMAVRKKDIAILGEGEAFVLRAKDGEIKAFKSVVTLSQNEGTLVQPVYNGPLIVSAQGYGAIARAAGVTTIFPKNVVVNGVSQTNPYPVRVGDSPNGRIKEVHCCAVTFGYSPLGIPMASSRTTIFDLPAYKTVDLLAKAKKTPQAFMVLPIDMNPDELGTNDKGARLKTWTHYQYDEAMNLWMDTSHDEVLSWLSQIVKREMKASEFAQTFATRNSQKHFFALQKVPCDNYRHSVVAWRPIGNNIVKWDATQYSDLQDRVLSMIEGDEDNGFQQKIEITHGTERTSEEEGFEALEAEADPEDSLDSGQKTKVQEVVKPPKKQSEPEVELSKVVAQAVYLAKEFPAEFNEALKLLKIDTSVSAERYDDQTAINVCQKVSELVDAQN